MKVITKTIHAYLNYPVAFSLMALPFALSLGQSHPMAKWLGVGTGVAAFVLTLLTDHKTGVIRVVPHSEHFAVDFLVGVMFVVAPFALGFPALTRGFTGRMAERCWRSSVCISLSNVGQLSPRN